LDLQKVFNSVRVAARQKVLFAIWHPRWALDAFWDFEIPQDLVVGYEVRVTGNDVEVEV
jgi:hypothetical protein